MKRMLTAAGIALLGLLAVAPMASAQRRVIIVRRPGPVFVGPGFYYGPSYYDPWWYGPRYTYYATPNAGEVKLETKMKDASVYVDGGYAGTAEKLKKFPLRAGTHDIELRDSDGYTLFQERVNVIAGKTVKIEAGNRG
jgi:hypothetical protein